MAHWHIGTATASMFSVQLVGTLHYIVGPPASNFADLLWKLGVTRPVLNCNRWTEQQQMDQCLAIFEKKHVQMSIESEQNQSGERFSPKPHSIKCIF